MSKENAVVLDLDTMSPGDGLDIEEHVIFDAYWAMECEGLAVIAHIYRHFDEERGAIIPERSHWYFGDSISIPSSAETGLATFGFNSLDDVRVQITLENGEVLRLPYRQLEY